MAYIIDEIKEEIKSDITIYVILSPIDRSFFVGKTEVIDLATVYKKHYYGEKPKTKELFEKSKEKKLLPQMYLLERLQATNETAYLYVIAWARYFIDHGYKSLCSETINQYAEELREDTRKIYERICLIPMETLCNDKRNYTHTIKSKQKTAIKKQRVNLILKPEEYDLIKQRADKCRMSMSKYCKSIVLSEQNKILDREISDLLLHYIEGFSRRDEMLKQILLTIYSTKKYYPVDLKILQDLIEKNEQQQQEAMDRVLEILREFKN